MFGAGEEDRGLVLSYNTCLNLLDSCMDPIPSTSTGVRCGAETLRSGQ